MKFHKVGSEEGSRPYHYLVVWHGYMLCISAEELGIKGLIPAYLDPNLKDEDLKTGVSFASGGCGYDPLTGSAFVSSYSFWHLKPSNLYSYLSCCWSHGLIWQKSLFI